VILIVIAIISYWISTLIPAFSNYVIDIIIRSSIIFILFVVPVYFFKISDDINDRIDMLLSKFILRNQHKS